MDYRLPRPCRYSDLTKASDIDAIPELALIADGAPEDLEKAIHHWRVLVPGSRLLVFYEPAFADAVQTAAKTIPSVSMYLVDSYLSLPNHPHASTTRAWASCAPYDAYGVIIKKPIESCIYKILLDNDGVYCAHDPGFGVVRWFDASGLRDRLRYRGIRLVAYRWTCRIVLAIAWVFSRTGTPEYKWRKI